MELSSDTCVHQTIEDHKVDGLQVHRFPVPFDYPDDTSSIISDHADLPKPALVPASAGSTLQFKLSHSHELTMHAVTRNFPIGFDLE